MIKSARRIALWVLALTAFAIPAYADRSDEPVKYVLETSTLSVPLGQSPGVRVLVQSTSALVLSHGLRVPDAYALHIHGPEGYSSWLLRQHIFRPEVFQLAPSERKYLFGTATSYLYPDAIVFGKRGVYHLQYCDRWLINGEEREACSNRVKVRVGNVGDGDDE